MSDTPRPGPWIIRLLEAYGVERVFGIPGVHTIALYDGLAASSIEHVTPRHEQGAGFMADAYARVSGKPGVCFVITGPGLTNITTAMAQAYSESVPMLVISSVSNRRHLGRGLGQLHELPDQQAIAAGVSAFSQTLHDLADLPAVLEQAFAVFTSSRPRPVHIEIPLDLWETTPPAAEPVAPALHARTRATDELVAEGAQRMRAARRPLIIAGGGARYAGGDIRSLAEYLDAPVVMTVNGRGILAPDHYLAVPASPSLTAVRELIADSDVVLAIGSEMGPTDYDMYELGMPAIEASLIRIDIDPTQLQRPRAADVPLLGDAVATLAALHEQLPAEIARADEGGAGAERAEHTRTAARDALDEGMQRALGFLEQIRDTLPEATLVGDSTNPIYAGNLYFAAARPGSWFNSAMGYGTLGYALPAALGARLADPERPVVCLTGDGGLHYTLGELAAIRAEEAPVIVIVWNNACFGEIRLAMEAENIEPTGVELFAPDWSTLAAAYGFVAARVDALDQLPDLLQAAAARVEPTLIELDEQIVLG